MTSRRRLRAVASCTSESVQILPKYLRGLTLLSTAHKSGRTLKPCSIRPIVKGNEPPATKCVVSIITRFLLTYFGQPFFFVMSDSPSHCHIVEEEIVLFEMLRANIDIDDHRSPKQYSVCMYPHGNVVEHLIQPTSAYKLRDQLNELQNKKSKMLSETSHVLDSTIFF